MRSRNRGLQFLIGALAGLALLAWGGALPAAAETLDLAAILSLDCAVTGDGEGLAFLDDLQATGAESTGAQSTAAPPEAAGKACRTNKQCTKAEWCAKADGECKSKGACKHKPLDCVGPDDPVCGCDHKDYKSACWANAHRTNVLHKGACKKKGY